MNDEIIIEVSNLSVHFRVQYDATATTGVRPQRSNVVKAIDGVNLKVKKGEIISIVGESGSGKTTLGRAISGLIRPTGGIIKVDDIVVNDLRSRALKSLWREVQVIFQDPYSTFDPLTLIYNSLVTPLKKFGLARTDPEGKVRVVEVLAQVGLKYSDVEGKYPSQLSGGQRQRVAIARALMIGPKVIIADEPVSMLDVSLRAGILDLLKNLNRFQGMTIIFVTHDLAVAEYISDRIAVMYRGKIVEQAQAYDLVNSPIHPYTELLLRSVPRMNQESVGQGRESTRQTSYQNAPSIGCKFYNRCPIGVDVCNSKVPGLQNTGEGEHYAACFVRNPNSTPE